jgi:hypothetical protein
MQTRQKIPALFSMNSIATVSDSAIRRPASPTTFGTVRYLYRAVAVLLLAITLLGFQKFYLHGHTARGAELPGSEKGLLIAHGVAMTLWILLFAVQPFLIAGGNRRLHITLGMFGAGLAACIVPLGVWVAIAMAKAEPNAMHSGGLNARQFLFVQFTNMLTFGTLTAVGIVARRHPMIHRPMLLLATLAVMGAAFGRVAPLRQLIFGTMWVHWFGPYFYPLVVGVGFLATKTALTRTFDRWLAGGLAALIVIDLVAMNVARTNTWESVAQLLVR